MNSDFTKLLFKKVNAKLNAISAQLADALSAYFASHMNSGSYYRRGDLVKAFRMARGVVEESGNVVIAEIYDTQWLMPKRSPSGYYFNSRMSLDGSTSLRDGTPLYDAVPWLMDEGFKMPSGKFEGIGYFRQVTGYDRMTDNRWVEQVEQIFEEAYVEIVESQVDRYSLGFKRLTKVI